MTGGARLSRHCVQIVLFGYSGGVTIATTHSTLADARSIYRSMNGVELFPRRARRQGLRQAPIFPLFGGQPFPLPNPVHLRITKRGAVRVAENAPGPLSGLYSVTVIVAADADV